MNKTKKGIKLRVLFAGTPLLAKDILKNLLNNNYNIVGTLTQPDKKVGRNQELEASPVKELSLEHKIPILQPAKLDSDTIEQIKELKPDLIIVAAYGKILPKKLLELPGFKCVNIHTSLLPHLRGPSPIQNSLLLGEEKTGVTTMLMDEGIDTGDIISQVEVVIDENDTTETLSKKLSKEGSDLLLKTIPLWINGKIKPQKQDSSKATLCQLIEKSDGKIFWNSTAEEIYNRFRAFKKWPGVFCFWETDRGIKRIKLTNISINPTENSKERHFGEVFEKDGKIEVQTADGAIVLESIQMEGKNEMEAGAFANGYTDFIGNILK
ncbi:methionyl-tRNA formyltransferase [Patescibacteria group bacterium]